MAIPKTELSSSDNRLRDQKARSIGLLIGLSGQLYTISISRVSDVYIEHIDGQWVGWRERHYTGDLQPSGVKIIVTGTFDHAMAKTEKYLKYIKKNRK